MEGTEGIFKVLSERKTGIIVSYATMITSSLTNIAITPFILNALGPAQWGLYQIINSFASFMLIADLGTGALMTRFLAVYIADDDPRGKDNFVALGLVISTGCAILIICAGIGMYYSIDAIYRTTMSAIELAKAKEMFVFLIVNMALSVYDKAFFGIVNAHEKFAVSKGTLFLKVIAKALLIVILLSIGLDVTALVATDLILTVAILIFLSFYCFTVLKTRVKYVGVDRTLLLAALTFAGANFFQSVVATINVSAGKVILGAKTDTTTTAVFAAGIIIVTAFNQIGNAVGSVYLPYMTTRIHQGVSSEEITDIVIKPGRLNFIICGLIVAVFIMFGDDFIKLWVGYSFEDAYSVALLLIIAYLIPQMESVTGSVLDAKNLRLMRSIIIAIVAIFTVVLSLILAEKMGAIGVAIASASAIVLGHWILLNLYYNSRIGLNVKRMFSEVIRGTWTCLLGSMALSSPFLLIEQQTLLVFLAECSTMTAIFILLQYKFGLNDSEKKIIQEKLGYFKSRSHWCFSNESIRFKRKTTIKKKYLFK